MDDVLFERMACGVSSACFALRRIPLIRYTSNSEACEKLAKRVSVRNRLNILKMLVIKLVDYILSKFISL